MTDTLLQRFVKIIKIYIQTSFFIPIAFASQFLKMVVNRIGSRWNMVLRQNLISLRERICLCLINNPILMCVWLCARIWIV